MLIRNTMRQGSHEWREWRRDGLGASDVRAAQGRCKYKSKWRLWAEKRGIVKVPDLSGNPHVRRGRRFESPVRSVIEKQLGVKLSVFCGQDDSYPWRRVSFDGVTPDNIPVEIKCPTTCVNGDETPEELEQLSYDRYVDLIQKRQDSILFDEYEPQLQYQMGMLDAPYGYLVFYFEHNEQMKIFKVPRNEKLVKEAFDAVDNLYLEHIEKFVQPEKDPSLDYYEPTEDELVAWDVEAMEFMEALTEERELRKQLKAAKERKDSAVNGLLTKAGNFNTVDLHGIKITEVKPREIFQYRDYMTDQGIVIDDMDRKKYTKMGKSSIRVSLNRDRTEQSSLKNRALKHQQTLAIGLLAGFSNDERNDVHSHHDQSNNEYFD